MVRGKHPPNSSKLIVAWLWTNIETKKRYECWKLEVSHNVHKTWHVHAHLFASIGAESSRKSMTKPGKGGKSSSWPLIFHLGPLTCWWGKLPRPAAGGADVGAGPHWQVPSQPLPPSTHPWLPPAPPQRRGVGSYCPACRRAIGGKSAPREPEKLAATRLGKWSCVLIGRAGREADLGGGLEPWWTLFHLLFQQCSP